MSSVKKVCYSAISPTHQNIAALFMKCLISERQLHTAAGWIADSYSSSGSLQGNLNPPFRTWRLALRLPSPSILTVSQAGRWKAPHQAYYRSSAKGQTTCIHSLNYLANREYDCYGQFSLRLFKTVLIVCFFSRLFSIVLPGTCTVQFSLWLDLRSYHHSMRS